MSVCAVMLVKDEADIIRSTIKHLLANVDYIMVLENRSEDKTLGILSEYEGDQLEVIDDPEIGYFQSDKTTRLALSAYERGFGWVLPCDADEIWYAPEGRTLSEYLDGVPPDVQMVRADLYNHLPSREDPNRRDPVMRIGWRQRQRAPLGKICARTRPDLVIEAGNHSAQTSGTALTVGGLTIRHFSWRSRDQYLRKIRNGEAAYRATDLPESTGLHWRMFPPDAPDEVILEHFDRWFFSDHPRRDASLILDPAPVAYS